MSATFSLVKGLVAAEKVIVSLHANKRFAESGLTTAEVEAGAATGIVVEDYPEPLAKRRKADRLRVVCDRRRGALSLLVMT